MQKIHPMLWFDNQAEEAAKHYVPIFPNSKLGTITKYGPAGPLAEGTVMTVDFELDAKAGSADPDHGWHEWPQGPRGHRAAGRLVELGWPWETVYREPYETLRRHCETIGRQFEDIVLTAGVEVSLPDDAATFEPTYEHSFYPGAVFHILGPTPADAISVLERLVDVGVSHFQVRFDDMTTFRRFIDEVIPAVRLSRRP